MEGCQSTRHRKGISVDFGGEPVNIIKAIVKFAKPLVPLNKRKIFFIVVHHPAIKTASPEQIHKWHLQRGWNGIGYNWYIRKDGTICECRGWHIGAQTANMNSKSVGVCFEGNYDKETSMPEVQLKAGVELIRKLLAEIPNKMCDVVPHKQLGKTACPGRYFPMTRLIQLVKKK